MSSSIVCTCPSATAKTVSSANVTLWTADSIFCLSCSRLASPSPLLTSACSVCSASSPRARTCGIAIFAVGETPVSLTSRGLARLNVTSSKAQCRALERTSAAICHRWPRVRTPSSRDARSACSLRRSVLSSVQRPCTEPRKSNAACSKAVRGPSVESASARSLDDIGSKSWGFAYLLTQSCPIRSAQSKDPGAGRWHKARVYTHSGSFQSEAKLVKHLPSSASTSSFHDFCSPGGGVYKGRRKPRAAKSLGIRPMEVGYCTKACLEFHGTACFAWPCVGGGGSVVSGTQKRPRGSTIFVITCAGGRGRGERRRRWRAEPAAGETARERGAARQATRRPVGRPTPRARPL